MRKRKTAPALEFIRHFALIQANGADRREALHILSGIVDCNIVFDRPAVRAACSLQGFLGFQKHVAAAFEADAIGFRKVSLLSITHPKQQPRSATSGRDLIADIQHERPEIIRAQPPRSAIRPVTANCSRFAIFNSTFPALVGNVNKHVGIFGANSRDG